MSKHLHNFQNSRAEEGVEDCSLFGTSRVGPLQHRPQAALGNMDTAWSGLKKEYCCENEGIGCQYVPGYDVAAQQPGQTPPRWLKLWLGDLSTGLKFMISGVAALLLGACCGAAMYARQMRAELAERRAQTEHELLHELQKALKRVGAKDGEIAVTLMWDTKDWVCRRVRKLVFL